MRKIILSVLAACLLALGRVTPEARLWLAIGVARPVLQEAEMRSFQLSFVVINDGNSTVDPGVEHSHLFINDVEPRDWANTINNGLRTSEFHALPPGEMLSFCYQLGKYFEKPGIYRVRWRIGNIQSPELTFRVLAGKK